MCANNHQVECLENKQGKGDCNKNVSRNSCIKTLAA